LDLKPGKTRSIVTARMTTRPWLGRGPDFALEGPVAIGLIEEGAKPPRKILQGWKKPKAGFEESTQKQQTVSHLRDH